MVYEISVSATKVRLYFDIASQKWKKIQIFAYNSRLELVGKEKPDYLNAKKLKLFLQIRSVCATFAHDF